MTRNKENIIKFTIATAIPVSKDQLEIDLCMGE